MELETIVSQQYLRVFFVYQKCNHCCLIHKWTILTSHFFFLSFFCESEWKITPISSFCESKSQKHTNKFIIFSEWKQTNTPKLKCSMENRKSYEYGTNWGDYMMTEFFFFRWTVPLSQGVNIHQLHSSMLRQSTAVLPRCSCWSSIRNSCVWTITTLT